MRAPLKLPSRECPRLSLKYSLSQTGNLAQRSPEKNGLLVIAAISPLKIPKNLLELIREGLFPAAAEAAIDSEEEFDSTDEIDS